MLFDGLLKQSTARTVTIMMIDSADHIAGKAGLTLTITASKNAAAFASITPTVVDLGSGWYSLAFTTTHTNTLGDFALHITAAGADPTDIKWQVVVRLPGEDATAAEVAAAVLSEAVTPHVGDGTTLAGYLDTINALVSALFTLTSSIQTSVDSGFSAASTNFGFVLSDTHAILLQTGTSGVKVVQMLDGSGYAPIRAGALQAVPSLTALNLDAGASNLLDFYKGQRLVLTSGTQKGQARIITAYDGVSKLATLNRGLSFLPVAGDTFAIMPVEEAGNTVTSPTAVENAIAVWNRQQDQHLVSGSFGWEIQEMEGRVGAFLPVSVPTAIQNADALLKRDWTAVTGEATRSVLNALRALRNKSDIVAGILIVMKEDDTTEAWRANVSTDANAEPIIGVDPTT